MSKKLDIRKELSVRKYKQTPKLYYWFYRTVMKVVGKKYNAEYKIIDDINKEEGPCFVIFNHLSRIDHMYVMEACYPKRINMLAGYNEFFRSHLHFAFKYNNVLPKKQYVNDMVGTKAIMQIIKKGGSVTFAPEGLASNDGMNKPIVPRTGSLLKHFKIPVYFVELRGEYLQNTKVCLDERYGKTYATLKKLFSVEDLERMSVEEIDDAINLAFKHDEYAWQKEKHIKWETRGNVASHLNDLLYRCPKCGSMFEMDAEKDFIKCRKCGNGATIDDYYDFHPYDESCVIPDTQSEWVRQERIQIIKEIRKNPNFEFVENVKLGMLPNDHYVKDHQISEVVDEGTLKINHDGFFYKSNKDEKYNLEIPYKVLYTLVTELDSSRFELYFNNELYEFFPEGPTTLYINMLVEEMHRLHVNFYKNFPWNDYMYENIED